MAVGIIPERHLEPTPRNCISAISIDYFESLENSKTTLCGHRESSKSIRNPLIGYPARIKYVLSVTHGMSIPSMLLVPITRLMLHICDGPGMLMVGAWASGTEDRCPLAHLYGTHGGRSSPYVMYKAAMTVRWSG